VERTSVESTRPPFHLPSPSLITLCLPWVTATPSASPRGLGAEARALHGGSRAWRPCLGPRLNSPEGEALWGEPL